MISRRLSTMLLTCAIFVVLAGLAAATEAPITECEEAKLWVAANIDDLPESLADLSRYSLVYRKAIHEVLPMAAREQLWLQHLDNSLQSGEWSAEQREFVESIRNDLHRVMLRSESDSAFAVGLHVQARKVLGRNLAYKTLAVLGPTEGNAISADCTCNVFDNDCPMDSTCTPSQETGCTQCCRCGILWTLICNGTCEG